MNADIQITDKTVSVRVDNLDDVEVLDESGQRVCLCGHNAATHTAVLLGGPEGSPCWVAGCPCYSFPKGLTLEQKEKQDDD